MRLSIPLSAALLMLAPLARAQTTFAELDVDIPPAPYNQGPEDEYFVASMAPGDVDNDGDIDLHVLASYVNFLTGQMLDLLTLYRNDGPGPDPGSWAFAATTEVLHNAGGITGDMAWGDYDSDGDLDVVVASFEATQLYRNDGGDLVLTDVELPLYDESAQFTPAPLDRRAITWADYDNDGDPDLLIPSVFRHATDYGNTVLLRNDGPGGPGGWAFTDAAAGLPDALDAQTAWGDTDSDGDLDLLLQENETFEASGFVRVFRNDGGDLTSAGPGFVTNIFGTADWMDYDSDGDLDVVAAGYLDNGAHGDAVVRVFRNDDGVYTPFNVVADDLPESWFTVHATTWADYDGDGDVDLLVSGADTNPRQERSVLFAQEGSTFFRTEAELPAQTFEDGGGAYLWFDLDGDLDLDHFVSTYWYPQGSDLPRSRTQLFRNDTPAPNAPPSVPSDLAASVSGDVATLSWAPATDGQTPSEGLTYSVWVQRNGSDIVSPLARPDGQRLAPEPGNVSHNTAWSLGGLEPGVYTWTVQAVDNAFNGGAFAAEGEFTVGAVANEPGGGLAADAFRLAVHPNPAREGAHLALTLGQAQPVTVALYDGLGRRVAVLHDGALAAGVHRLPLDVSGLAPGAYVARAAGADGRSAAVRVSVLR